MEDCIVKSSVDIKEKITTSFLSISVYFRNCIGQNFAMNEIKVMVSRLIHRYVLFSVGLYFYLSLYSLIHVDINDTLMKALYAC